LIKKGHQGPKIKVNKRVGKTAFRGGSKLGSQKETPRKQRVRINSVRELRRNGLGRENRNTKPRKEWTEEEEKHKNEISPS